MSSEESLFKQLHQDKGDFYVNCDQCIVCGAPETVAPDLIDHSKLEYGVCYFKKQPETPEEVRQAIDAMSVSCIEALRYRGKNETILKRLCEIGLDHLCDEKAVGSYKEIIRNRVTFEYNGTINELSDSLVKGMTRWKEDRVFNFKTNGDDRFEFLHKWSRIEDGINYACTFSKDGCEISFTGRGVQKLQAKSGWRLHHILIKDNRVSEITWFGIDKSNKSGTLFPY